MPQGRPGRKAPPETIRTLWKVLNRGATEPSCTFQKVTVLPVERPPGGGQRLTQPSVLTGGRRLRLSQVRLCTHSVLPRVSRLSGRPGELLFAPQNPGARRAPRPLPRVTSRHRRACPPGPQALVPACHASAGAPVTPPPRAQHVLSRAAAGGSEPGPGLPRREAGSSVPSTWPPRYCAGIEGEGRQPPTLGRGPWSIRSRRGGCCVDVHPVARSTADL